MTVRPLAALLCLLAALPLPALEVREVRWGVGGRLVGAGFTPLAVLVEQPGPLPFDGVVTLSDGGSLARSGVPWMQPCYLAAGGSRWLLFAPWVAAGHSFRLEWPSGGIDLPQASAGPSATILLCAEDGPGLGAHRLPDVLFPATASLCDSLARLVIDRSPRWTPAQRQACATWVRGGGELHLAADAAGHLPALTGELATLTQDAGLGRLVRHPDRTAAGLLAILTPPPPPREGPMPAGYEAQRAVTEVQRRFGALAQARPRWGLVILILLAFLAVIGPGAWWVARRRPWWAAQGLVLATTVLATLALAWVGRRGQGEAAITRLAVVARDLGAGTWDATWLASTFVTGAEHLRLRPPVPGRALLACPAWEPVDGHVLDTGDGVFATDLPLFSTRHWAARGACPAPLSAPAVVFGPAGRDLRLAQVHLGPDWPAAQAAWLLAGDRVHPLSAAGGGLWRTGDGLAGRVAIGDLPDDLGEVVRPLALQAAPAPGHTVLLIAAPLPEALRVAGAPGAQTGLLLYRRDIPREAP